MLDRRLIREGWLYAVGGFMPFQHSGKDFQSDKVRNEPFWGGWSGKGVLGCGAILHNEVIGCKRSVRTITTCYVNIALGKKVLH